MADFIVQVAEPRGAGPKCATLLLLHGLGADEHDLLGIAAELPEYRIVTLRAPFDYFMGYQWYRMGADTGPDRKTLDQAQDYLAQFIREELPRRYPDMVDDGLFLGGFSQGALMSVLYTLAQGGGNLKGTVALSGYLPESVRVPANLKGYPVFWGHGTEDAVLAFDWGREAADYLSAAGAALTFCSYPIGHGVSREEMDDLRQWLNRQIRVQAP